MITEMTDTDLSKFKQACIELEQERIINLLSNADKNKTHSRSTECSLCQAIELIKGETE